MLKSTTDKYNNFCRRRSAPVCIGNTVIGGGNPVAVQTMTDTDTNDIEASLAQIGRIRSAGCRIVRLTVQGMKEADSIVRIAARVREQWPDVALVADVHFLPEVALRVAPHVDKVRINPGNYRGGDFDALLDECAAHGTALRIGVNHGSLSADIVEQYGDTPRGMAESAMDFLRRCRNRGFGSVVVSMKSSNVRVMVHAYRMLADRMAAEGMDFPLHLGVTEAGSGAEGRIKSAAGIGALLVDGVGDTIRVSLTEPPENEIPAAQAIVDYFAGMEKICCEDSLRQDSLQKKDGLRKEYYKEYGGWNGFRALFDPYSYNRRTRGRVGRLGGGSEPLLWNELDESESKAVENGDIALLTAAGNDPVGRWRGELAQMEAAGDLRPVILHRLYSDHDPAELMIEAAADFGVMFLDGLADGLFIEAPAIPTEAINDIALDILQAARARISRTEFIACPGCGRTLFDLHGTLEAVKNHTSHLKGVKIAVMGCIVNGPGEMADADYGYVGAAPGRITLYRGKEPLLRNIPQEEALEELITLLKQDDKWQDLP